MTSITKLIALSLLFTIMKTQTTMKEMQELTKDAQNHYWLSSYFYTPRQIEKDYCNELIEAFFQSGTKYDSTTGEFAKKILSPEMAKHRNACRARLNLDLPTDYEMEEYEKKLVQQNNLKDAKIAG